MIVKIPTAQGALEKKGSERAPDEIIKELENIFLNEEGKELTYQIDEIEPVKENIEETNNRIYEKAKEILKGNKKVIFLGGDHSVTYPLFKAFSELNKEPCLLMFDAHPDCLSDFKISHEDFLRVLLEEGILKKENIVLVGLRSWHKDELNYLKENKIRFFTAKQLFNNLEDSCDFIMEFIRNFDSLYISIDIDALEPSCAPGTGYIEPGGLATRELLYLLERIKMIKSLKAENMAVDIVEVNPEKDVNNITSRTAAKIIAEVI